MQDSFQIESTPSFPVWLPRALPPIELLRSIKHCSRPGYKVIDTKYSKHQAYTHSGIVNNYGPMMAMSQNSFWPI